MKLRCPHCRLPVSKKAIDRAESYAICPHCQLSFDIGGWTADFVDSGGSSGSPVYGEFYSAEIPQELTNYPPSGTQLKQDASGVMIKASTRSLTNIWFLIIFAVGWNVVIASATINVVSALFTGSDTSGWVLLFFFPFWLVGLFMASQALMALFGKIEIVIGQESYVFTGLGPLGRKKRFDWNTVESIYTRTFTTQDPEGRVSRKTYLFIDGSNRVKFGKQLSGAKQSYILEILKYLQENRK